MVATETPAALATSLMLMAASPLSPAGFLNRLHRFYSALIIAYLPKICKENCDFVRKGCKRLLQFGTFHKEKELFLAANSIKGGGQRLFLRAMMKPSDETGYIEGRF